ncbi:MAG: hypothetical protein K6B40_04135 [Firmicutes bacterium]|nr:hypothetical protein [Bacillota bacterium]
MDVLPFDSWCFSQAGLHLQDGPQAMFAYQQAALQRQARWAVAHSPFYRRLYRDVDWAYPQSWPLMTQEDLRRFERQLVCLPQSGVQRIVSQFTSGSAGPAKRVYFSREDLAASEDFFVQGLQPWLSAGGALWICLSGPEPDGLGQTLAQAGRRLNAEAYVLGEKAAPDQAAALAAQAPPQVLIGAPRPTLALARALPGLRPQTVFLSTDDVEEATRRQVSRLWQCRTLAHWGMTETGWGGGLECAPGSGYHLRHGDLYVEIIHPQSGEILPPGEEGEVVISTLNRRAMPLLRYRTGDISRLLPGPCPCCGGVLPRLGPVRGHRLP